jgi:hypothetical protein
MTREMHGRNDERNAREKCTREMHERNAREKCTGEMHERNDERNAREK